MSEWIVYSKDGLTERCRLKRLEYNGSFMNERTISATFEYHSEVAFDVFDYIVYRNEKFELESIPSVKKISNHNYEYELRFVSLKYELERCEMRDIVPKDNGVTYPTPLTFSFTGDVRYLTERIQANLDSLYGEGVWSIVIPEGVKSEEKNITISQQNCWNALSLVNTTYNLTFSIKGRVITVGGEQSLVGHVFQYGKGKGLYEIERVSDTDTGIVTKVRAYGGTRNLDYSYPKRPEWTDSVLPVSFALSPLRLMLPSFKLDGKTDYVLADDSIINEYGIREASVVYDDIYPSITGMLNYDDEPIDEIKSVDEVDDSKDTFVVYLYDLGFDLESNLTTENAQISMKSGSLIGYTFNISEIEKQEDNSYKITLGRITNEEGDTGNFNIPNSQWSIAAGDKFVLLNILMPQEYIRNAEERLLERAKEYLNEYGRTNFSYNVGLHDKFLKENADIYEELIEGSKLRIYDQNLGISEDVTIQSITITENMGDNMLTQVKVTLNNKPSASTIERIQGQIKELSETSAGQFSTQSELLKQYRRKLDKPFFDRLFAAVDINGNEIPSTDLSTPIAYIKARYSVASIGGFTMYLNDNSYNLPSIYDGLPIDNNTIYWEDVDGSKVLKAKGGGGIAESVSWSDITGKPEWLLDGKISYSEIEGTPDLSVYALKRSLSEYVTKTELSNLDYADKEWVKEYVVDINTGNITAITKQMVIEALGYTPYDNSNPNGYVTSDSIPSLDGYATEDWVIKKGYLTSIPSDYITESELTAKGYATALSVNAALGNKVDKVSGKQLSTEDFTTALKNKLNSLSNYDDTAISNAITQLRRDFNTLVDGDASTAIDTFNEIIAFLNGVQDNQDLSSIIASIEQQIAAKYTKPSGGIPKSDLVQAVQTSLGKADSALQSHQSIYTLTFQSGTFASGSFTANSGNKTINIPTTTSHVSEGSNLYFTNARAVSALGDTLKSYVTLSGSQTVSGEKNFMGGLKVNGSPIVYDAAKKYWKLEGDLLITGGLTMYGSDSSFTPSTIMDAIAVDGTTISKEGGVLRVIGGGGISSITKQMVIDALGFTPISSSDVPTALPNPHSLKFGSKLYDGSASKTILASDLGITWDDILGRPTLLSSFTDDVVAGKYLPLTGGTIISTGRETLLLRSSNSFGPVLDLQDSKGNIISEIGHIPSSASNYVYGAFWTNIESKIGFVLGNDGIAYVTTNPNTLSPKYTIWHEGNFTPANYLPLSGGTITSSDGVPLNINSTAGYTVIRLQINGINYSVFGADEYWGTYLGVVGKNQKLGIKPDGTPFYNEYSLIHSGNIGSQSVSYATSAGNANALDNMDSTDFFRILGTNNNIDDFGDNSDKNGIVYINDNKGGTHNAPFSYGSVLSINHQAASWMIGCQSNGELKYRHRWWSASGVNWSDWKTLAFTDSNITGNAATASALTALSSTDDALSSGVRRKIWMSYPDGTTGRPALSSNLTFQTDTNTLYSTNFSGNLTGNVTGNAASATKLQTARTIWGQSFDGSKNVSGSINLGKNAIGYSLSEVWTDDEGNTHPWYGLDFSTPSKFATLSNWYGIRLSVGDKNEVITNGTFVLSNDSPSIIFRRGTTVDDKCDWTITDTGGYLTFKESTNGTERTALKMCYTQGIISDWNVTAPNFIGNLTGNAASAYKIIDSSGNNKVYIHSLGYVVVNGFHFTSDVIERKTNDSLYLQYNSTGNTIINANGGNVGIGTTNPSQKLHVNGNILTTGGITMYSQKSLKNIVDEEGLTLEQLKTIKPTRYTWKDNRDNRIHFGGIADDIQQVLPEVVYNANGVLTMDYGNAGFAIASSLIKPVIDHEQRIKALEKENEELKQEIKRLRA